MKNTKQINELSKKIIEFARHNGASNEFILNNFDKLIEVYFKSIENYYNNLKPEDFIKIEKNK